MARPLPTKRIIAVIVSCLLLALLVWHVDTRSLLANFRQTRWGLFAAAMALFVPQILVIAWRWKRLITPFTPLPLTESVRLVLVGASMNLLLPGKLGDLSKGWFLAQRGHVSRGLGLGVVAFEKMLDVAALALFMLSGVALLLWREFTGAPMIRNPVLPPSTVVSANDTLSQPALFTLLLIAGGIGIAAVAAVAVLYFVPLDKIPGFGWVTNRSDSSPKGKVARLLRSTQTATATLRARGSRRGEIIAWSGLIWVLHLAQIYLLFACVNAAPAPGDFLCMVPLAIFVGLIPISIAGFGTRDAALVALLPMLPASAVLAASLYINLRYILPAIAGFPYLPRYLVYVREEKMAQGENI